MTNDVERLTTLLEDAVDQPNPDDRHLEDAYATWLRIKEDL